MTEAISNRARKRAEERARKARIVLAEHVQYVAASLVGKQAEGFPICNLCRVFSARIEEAQKKGCYLVHNKGAFPNRGFCSDFEPVEGITELESCRTVNFSGDIVKKIRDGRNN